MEIKKTLRIMGVRTGTLIDLREEEISYMLTFKPNASQLDTSPDLKHCWSFEVNGSHHCVWSYKNGHARRTWATSGTDEFFQLVFGDHYISLNHLAKQPG